MRFITIITIWHHRTQDLPRIQLLLSSTFRMHNTSAPSYLFICGLTSYDNTCHVITRWLYIMYVWIRPKSMNRKMKSTQHCPSEEVAEKVSVVPAPWILMVDITWLACVASLKVIMKNQQLHHWCSCLSWKTWWLTCLTFMLNINLLIHSWRGKLKKKKDGWAGSLLHFWSI